MNPGDRSSLRAFNVAAVLHFFGLGPEPPDAKWRGHRTGRVYGRGSRKYDGPRPVRIDWRPKRIKGALTGVPFAVRKRRQDPRALAHAANKQRADEARARLLGRLRSFGEWRHDLRRMQRHATRYLSIKATEINRIASIYGIPPKLLAYDQYGRLLQMGPSKVILVEPGSA